MNGEKRIALALLNELLEINTELEHITASRPDFQPLAEQAEAAAKWAEAVDVQSRKVQAALRRHGIHSYDALVGSPYNPALHERVGSRRMEGMDPLRIAEQREHGYASQQPEFVLRRPKVIVSE
jgi:molecular chaperone GrpE (heat shock protein)